MKTFIPQQPHSFESRDQFGPIKTIPLSTIFGENVAVLLQRHPDLTTCLKILTPEMDWAQQLISSNKAYDLYESEHISNRPVQQLTEYSTAST